MKKPIIILLFLLLPALFATAQDMVKTRSQPDSIIEVVPVQVGSHISYLYTIGGKIQTPMNVRIKLLAYTPSATEYHQAKTDATWGYALSAGFAVSAAAAVIEFAHNNKWAGATTGPVNGEAGFIYQHHSLAGAYIFTGIATAFLTSSIINFVHAVKHTNKALKVYNQRFE
jgi:hypothetical protein